MRVERVGLALVLAAALAGCMAENQAATASAPMVKGGSDETGEYMAAVNWWKPAPDHPDEAACEAKPAECWVWGEVSGAAADSPDRIIVAVWGDMNEDGDARPGGTNYVVEVNRNGDMIANWTQWDTLFNRPHQVYISPYDPERAIYIVERGGKQPGPTGAQVHEAVYKFSNDGKSLIWALRDPRPVPGQTDAQGVVPAARSVPNPGQLDFGQAAVLTFTPDGHFLLGDGYQNGRIQKWTTDGKWVSEFGEVDRDDDPTTGTPGQFDLIHGVAVDKAGRIYVGDRSNNRVQVFTPEGEFIEQWPGVIDPVGIYVDESESVWVVSAALNRMLKYNTQGQLLYHWGAYGRTNGGFPGGHARPHEVDVDQEGNVYITSWDAPNGYLSKFTPKPNADPAKLIGQKIGTSGT